MSAGWGQGQGQGQERGHREGEVGPYISFQERFGEGWHTVCFDLHENNSVLYHLDDRIVLSMVVSYGMAHPGTRSRSRNLRSRRRTSAIISLHVHAIKDRPDKRPTTTALGIEMRAKATDKMLPFDESGIQAPIQPTPSV